MVMRTSSVTEGVLAGRITGHNRLTPGMVEEQTCWHIARLNYHARAK
jgi:hypothetical protein